MAAKTANVLARVEPDVKEQAEAIMAKLGIPVSTVINMLYKQIIMTRSIPFALSVRRLRPACELRWERGAGPGKSWSGSSFGQSIQPAP